jgi:DNA-binding CsgD family transcriptional regulator
MGRTDIAARLITDLTDHPLRSDHVLDELRAEVDLRTGHAETGMTRLVRPSAEWTIDNLAAWATHRVWLCRWAKNPVQALADGLAVAEQARGTDADYQSGLLAACAGAAADVAVAARARRDPDRFASAQAALDRLTALTGAFAGGTRQRVQKRAEELEQHAEYQRANGDHAVAPWTAAAHEWTRLERPHRAAYAWWRLAEELLSGDPDPTAAREVLQRGFEDSEGHLPLRQSITDLAHRAHLRLATHSTEPGGADTASLPVHLTEREVTVLRLVAEGMTNVEIGEHLFISPKTVSVHVSNILPKLNVRSRVQAAAWADQVGLVRRPTQ